MTELLQYRTAKLNIHLEDPVSTKTIQHEFHKSNMHGRAAIVKTVITENNEQMCKQWCHNHQTTGNMYVIWSD
jgi:cobyrinic acid a,c-diamide synthase